VLVSKCRIVESGTEYFLSEGLLLEETAPAYESPLRGPLHLMTDHESGLFEVQRAGRPSRTLIALMPIVADGVPFPSSRTPSESSAAGDRQ